MRDGLLNIFQETYRELRPSAAMPEIAVEFFAFANINNTIRMRRGKAVCAPFRSAGRARQTAVLQAIAHILLAKMYRKPIERAHATRYRRYISGHDIAGKLTWCARCAAANESKVPKAETYDLEKIFDDLNTRFFYGLLARPQMTWSRDRARNRLGHYDPAHNAIVVSRVFDHPRVPRYAVEYIVYHEMLHLKHPVKLRGSRRCVHSAEFQAEEKLFPRLGDAKLFLKRL